MYYGQCSELCGKDHAFMPIAVRVVKDQRIRRLGRRREEEISPAPNSAPTDAFAAGGRMAAANSDKATWTDKV